MTATLIYNPIAGKDPGGKKIQAVREALEGIGVPHRFKPTLRARDGTRLAKEAVAQGSRLLIVAGGDGTVNEVVNGLVGTEVPLALIPLGTGNLAAYEFGISLNPVQAALAIPKSRVQRIDVGKANDRFFLMMVSVGLDAQALRDAPTWAYSIFSWWAFYVTGFLCLLTTRPFSLQVKMDGDVLHPRVRLLVISNIKGYGLPGCELISQASVVDGMLDLGFFKSQDTPAYLKYLTQLGRHRQIDGRLLHHHPLKTARIETETPVPVQMDGDFYGYTPVEVSVVPNGLSILIPAPRG